MLLTKASLIGGKLVEVQTDVLTLISKVREKLQANDPRATTAEALTLIYRHHRFLGGTPGTRPSDESTLVDDILNATDARADLLERLSTLERYLIQLGDALDPVVSTVGDAPHTLSFPLNVNAKGEDLGVGDIAFVLGGDAGVTLTAASFPNDKLPEDWQGDVASDSALQALSVKGHVEFRGSGNGAFGHGAVNFSASTKGSGRITLYHQYASATTRAAALEHASNAWALPWELDKLDQHLQPITADGHAVGLRRVQISGQGVIELAGGARVGRVIDLGTPQVGVKGDVAGSFEFSVNRSGEFAYRIEKDADGFVVVDLSKKSESRTSRSVDLGADITVTGLDTVARIQLDRFFDDPGDLLKKLDGWTRPGDRLIDRLKPADWQEDVVSQISRLLLGESSPDGLNQLAVGKLQEKLGALLNEHIPFWGEEPEDIADQLIAAVAQRLDLGDIVAAQLHQAAKPTLKARIEEVLSGFESDLADKVKGAGAGLEQLLAPLESVGADVAELAADLDGRAAEIIDAATKLLRRYEQLRKKLMRGIEKAARVKIGVAYAAERHRTEGEASLLRFRIREVNPLTRAVHRAFLLGRMDKAWSMFREAQDDDTPSIDQVSGRFSAFATTSRSVGFSFSFGGSELSLKRVKASDVDVQVSPSGTVLVAAVKISQENIVKAFKVQRSAGFTASYDLAAAAEEPDAVATPVGFNLSYADERMKPKELESFLASLERPVLGRSLLAAGAAVNARAHFGDLKAVSQGGADARVDVVMPVAIRELGKLVGIDDDRIRQRAADMLIDVVFQSDDDRGWFFTMAQAFDDGLTHHQFIERISDMSRRTAVARIERKLGFGLGTTRTSDGMVVLRRARDIGRDIDALAQAVQGVRGIAALQKELAALPDAPPRELANSLRARLDGLTDDINDGLDNWLKARRPISGIFSEAVPFMTVTLLALIADLSSETTNLVPIVSVNGTDGEQIAVL